MGIVTGDRYLERLSKFLEDQTEPLIEGSKVLKLNPAGLHYVHSRLEVLDELDRIRTGAPVDYLRAYVSDLGDFRTLRQLRRILPLLTSLKVVSVLPPPVRDPTPLSLLPFDRLKVLELRGCDLSTSAAKGLLELRHTLEKIICHNSTDALRHLFAGRIAEIRGSQRWNKLSFVSCACNRLVLMDESLQLLPAVEVLDLSRNRFAKVDNLRNCVKLSHLDLGFNHLRSLSFGEVPCHIVKLVLRNNALTTLSGIENLKSLEGLDLSYNLISNFSELEFLGGLSTLKSLWLEGNPLCCARWYRAQVFSCFAYPYKLKLDDKEIGTKEVWMRQIIIARRQKRPASFGFYFPAHHDCGEVRADRKKKKMPRLASIDSEEESTCVCSDQDSISSKNEIQSKDMDTLSDGEAEIYDLMTRVENLKKESSVLWLQEIKQWMDPSAEKLWASSNSTWAVNSHEDKPVNNNKNQKHNGVCSGNFLSSAPTPGNRGNTNDPGYHDSRTVQCINCNGILRTVEEISSPRIGSKKSSGVHEKFFCEGTSSTRKNWHSDGLATEGKKEADNIVMASSSSLNLRSPPHYQKDVLHRRQNLVDEILELSADSYSVVSSDGMISSSDEDFYDSEESVSDVDLLVGQEAVNKPEVSGVLRSARLDQMHEAFSATSASPAREDLIENYFMKKVADSRKKETCKIYIRCYCLVEEQSYFKEREVALLLSSEDKLYVLLLSDNEPGATLTLLGCHRINEVKHAAVSLALQVVRIYIEGGTTYLYVTNSIEKSEELLNLLQILGSQGNRVQCSVRSLEQVQVELLEKQICGGSKLSILQYSIVQYCRNLIGDESWLTRSLFLTRRDLLLCLEDLARFGILQPDDYATPYMSLDSCCAIADVSELRIEKRGMSLRLLIVRERSGFYPSSDGIAPSTGSATWKLKWYSEEGLWKFVVLLKALSREIKGCPLLVKSV